MPCGVWAKWQCSCQSWGKEDTELSCKRKLWRWMLLHNQCKLMHTIDLTSDFWLTYFVFVQKLWEQSSPDPRNKGYSYITTNTLHHNCVHLAVIQSLMKEIKIIRVRCFVLIFSILTWGSFCRITEWFKVGRDSQLLWKKLTIFSLSSKHEVYLSSSCSSRGKKKKKKWSNMQYFNIQGLNCSLHEYQLLHTQMCIR